MSSIDTPAGIIEFARIFLASFYSFVALFYTIKIIMEQGKEQVELVHPGDKFCKTWWNHMTFRVFRISIWMVCVFRFLFPDVDNYLGIINAAQTTSIIVSGIVLMTIGFAMTLITHFYMGNKWRSGIDPFGPKQLITTGFFKYSRNPIFLSVAISQLGFFLALPSVFTLVCLVIGVFTLYRQVLSEEEHLLHVFANKYEAYKANVRRWI